MIEYKKGVVILLLSKDYSIQILRIFSYGVK